jgi:hypothetical protein
MKAASGCARNYFERHILGSLRWLIRVGSIARRYLLDDIYISLDCLEKRS